MGRSLLRDALGRVLNPLCRAARRLGHSPRKLRPKADPSELAGPLMGWSRRALLGAAAGLAATPAAADTGDMLSALSPGAGVVEIEVMGSTPLVSPDPGERGINCAGWAIRVRTVYTGAVPDGSKALVVTEDPGYRVVGGAMVSNRVTRRLATATALRVQALNTGALPVHSVTTGIYVDHWFSLLEPIWAKTRIKQVVMLPGFYGRARPGIVPAHRIRQNSNLAYEKAVAGWFNLQHDRATGSTFHVELWAMHESAMGGQGVAGVEFIGSDGTNTAATQTAGTPQLSTIQTQGPIAECYPADIPLSALDQQGATATPNCTVNAKVYPHIGDASAVLDLAVDGVAWGSNGTPSPQTPLRFANDKNGTYGGLYAYVDAANGNDGTGVCSTTAATARATPFATIAGALNTGSTGIVAVNGSGAGGRVAHADHGGAIIRLKDNAGANQTATLSATLSTASGACWLTIEADPLNTAVASYDLSATRTVTNGMINWRCNVTRSAAAQFGMTAGTGKMMAVSGGASVALNAGNTTPWINGADLIYQQNVTYPPAHAFAALQVAALGQNGSTAAATALILGVIWQSTTIPQNAIGYVMIGCTGMLFPKDKASGQASRDGFILANCIINNWTGTAQRLAENEDFVRGFAIVQNVFEVTEPAGTDVAISGGGAGNNVKNGLVAYNAFPGSDDVNQDDGRVNHVYTDVVATLAKTKWVPWKFNWANRQALKTDHFARNNSGLTGGGYAGNLVVAYGCRSEGNVLGFNRPVDPTGAEIFRRAADARTRTNTGTIAVNDNRSGKTGAGFGTYTPNGSASHPLYGVVAPRRGLLRYDLAAQLRIDNAAGPYEMAA